MKIVSSTSTQDKPKDRSIENFFAQAAAIALELQFLKLPFLIDDY